jgi:hypothetical protein
MDSFVNFPQEAASPSSRAGSGKIEFPFAPGPGLSNRHRTSWVNAKYLFRYQAMGISF